MFEQRRGLHPACSAVVTLGAHRARHGVDQVVVVGFVHRAAAVLAGGEPVDEGDRRDEKPLDMTVETHCCSHLLSLGCYW